ISSQLLDVFLKAVYFVFVPTVRRQPLFPYVSEDDKDNAHRPHSGKNTEDRGQVHCAFLGWIRKRQPLGLRGCPAVRVRLRRQTLQHSNHEVGTPVAGRVGTAPEIRDRKSTRLNSSHVKISYAVFCLKKK